MKPGARPIRSVDIPIHNTQLLQVFTRLRRPGVFDVWIVTAAAGHREVHDHYLTRDDLEGRLHYSRPGDLAWRDATPSEIPADRGTSGFVMGATIPARKVLDFDSLCDHLTGAIVTLPLDRRALAAARRGIPGQWSDGTTLATFERPSRLRLSPPGRPYPFDGGANCPPPDSWTFGSWQLRLMNKKHHCGVRVSVLRVDQDELHVGDLGSLRGRPGDALAHVFRRKTGPHSSEPRRG